MAAVASICVTELSKRPISPKCQHRPIVNNTGVEWYRVSCNGRRVLVVNKKQSAPNLNEPIKPASIIKSATFLITVFAFVNNAGYESGR